MYKFITSRAIICLLVSAVDAQLLARVGSKDGGSPAMELFKDMNGRGKTVWELHQLAQQCRLQAVCDVIVQGVRSEPASVYKEKFTEDICHRSWYRGGEHQALEQSVSQIGASSSFPDAAEKKTGTLSTKSTYFSLGCGRSNPALSAPQSASFR